MSYLQIAIAGAIANALLAVGMLSWQNAVVAILIGVVTWVEYQREEKAAIEVARARVEAVKRAGRSSRT